MAKKGTVREALESAQDSTTFGSTIEYIERERRVVKRRVRKNNAWAAVWMVFAVMMFILSVSSSLVYWTGTFTLAGDGADNAINQVAKKIYSFTADTSTVTANEIARYYGAYMGVIACAFFGCLAFRRGTDKRTKGGWLLVYILSTIGMLALYWFWCVKNVCGGDMNLWIQNLSTSYSGSNFIFVAVFAVVSFIALLAVRGAGLMAGKADRIRRRENGKIHGGVCLMYFLLSILSVIGILVMIIAAIVDKIRLAASKDDDDFDLAPVDEWEEEQAKYE